ncbi:MAG: cbb3-type cytochrome c oxidase subunit II, partial [Paracoccaceae bacterium]
ANRVVGVPYSDAMMENALVDFLAQADPMADSSGLEERYGEAAFGTLVNVRNFDGQAELTEMDALIAYIQVLGTMVDFSTFTPDASR